MKTKLSWECTKPSPDYVWSLGERYEEPGKPTQIKNVVAHVERTAGGKWRWIAYTGDGASRWGFEPSRDTAMQAAEAALPNNPAQQRAH